ncbi:MAG: FG-GAP-like repeat-containing protein, partial [Planctomycetota bacterium]
MIRLFHLQTFPAPRGLAFAGICLIWLSSPGLRSQQFLQIFPWDSFPQGIHTVTDLTDDGAPEQVYRTSWAGRYPTVAYRDGHGNGMFGSSTLLPLPSGHRQESGLPVTAVADFDGDGDNDVLSAGGIIVGNPGNGTPAPWLYWDSLGNSQFAVATYDRIPSTIVNSIFPAKLRAMDVDGDGDLDVATIGSTSVDFLLNDGRGYFQLAGYNLPISTMDIVGGDLDNDGDLDFLASTYNVSHPGYGVVFLNNGNGTYLQTQAPIILASGQADLGDIDGDGDLDAIHHNRQTYPYLWINDGHGYFTDESHRIPRWRNFPPGTHSHRRGVIWLRDIDNDGDLDIIDSFILMTRILINDGTGHFTDGTVPWGMWRDAVEISFAGDIDRDGDIDLFGRGVESPGYRAILFNLLRHIHTDTPTLGNPFDIHVHAEPNAFVTFGVALARADLFLPFGLTWALDPASTVVWPRLHLMDSSRSWTNRWQVPNDPGLVGLDLYFQAIEFQPA